MQVKIKRTIERVRKPTYANDGDACFDIAVHFDELNPPKKVSGDYKHFVRSTFDGCRTIVCIAPRETYVFRTGLAFEVPRGHAMLIYSRSSTGFRKQLALTNGTSVIDSGYRGEVQICLTNIGNTVVSVADGDRVAQACVLPLPEVELVEAEELDDSERGENGIGSSGR